MVWANRLIYFVFILFLVSCMQEHVDTFHVAKQSKASQSPNVTFLKTYSYQQTTSYTCGPAVIMTLLKHYGRLNYGEMNRQTEMRIAAEMGTTEWGTQQEQIAHWLEQNGFNVSYGQGVTIDMILDSLKSGVPIIISWNDWSGHLTLAVGYKNKELVNGAVQNIILIADPSSSNAIVANNTLVRGINEVGTDQLQSNWFFAKYYFNPNHVAIGMYIIATPKR